MQSFVRHTDAHTSLSPCLACSFELAFTVKSELGTGGIQENSRHRGGLGIPISIGKESRCCKQLKVYVTRDDIKEQSKSFSLCQTIFPSALGWTCCPWEIPHGYVLSNKHFNTSEVLFYQIFQKINYLCSTSWYILEPVTCRLSFIISKLLRIKK